MIYEVWRGSEKLTELPGHDAAQLFGDEWHNLDPEAEHETPLAIVPSGYELVKKS